LLKQRWSNISHCLIWIGGGIIFLQGKDDYSIIIFFQIMLSLIRTIILSSFSDYFTGEATPNVYNNEIIRNVDSSFIKMNSHSIYVSSSSAIFLMEQSTFYNVFTQGYDGGCVYFITTGSIVFRKNVQ